MTIRLSESDLRRIEELTEKYGVSQSIVLRWSLEALVKYVDLHGGDLHLPVDLTAEWRRVSHSPPEQAAGPPGLDSESRAAGLQAAAELEGSAGTGDPKRGDGGKAPQ